MFTDAIIPLLNHKLYNKIKETKNGILQSQEACTVDMRLKFKKGLVPICVNYFFLFIGFGLCYPYMTLQMMSLGLTLSDAGIINGMSPIVGFILTPLAGYAGDKLGYKMVLIFSIIIYYRLPQNMLM